MSRHNMRNVSHGWQCSVAEPHPFYVAPSKTFYTAPAPSRLYCTVYEANIKTIKQSKVIKEFSASFSSYFLLFKLLLLKVNGKSKKQYVRNIFDSPHTGMFFVQ
jgi:ATP/ADP translocase